MELDRHRRALHEGLMARVNFANRLCVKMNTPVLAERVTEEDRETYFAFAKEVVDSYFGEAIPPTMMAGIASIMASKASRIPEQTYSRTMSSKQV